MDPALTTPLRLDLKRDEKLVIEWQDGHVCTYPLAYLRKNCPCATCKTFREEQAQKPRTRLTVFSKTSEGPLTARHCLLYTSDAADERSSVDLGGRRIIKK